MGRVFLIGLRLLVGRHQMHRPIQSSYTVTAAVMPLSLHMTSHLPRSVPRNFRELSVNDLNKIRFSALSPLGEYRLERLSDSRRHYPGCLDQDSPLFACSPEDKVEGCGQKIPFHNQLADPGVQLLDFLIGDRRPIERGTNFEHRRHVRNRSTLSDANHRRVNAVHLGQLGRRKLLADGF